MMSKIYADNLARSNSNSSRGTAGRRVAMQATGRGLSNINCHYCNKFSHNYKNNCTDFKAVHEQNQRGRQKQHKQRGGHQPHQPKPGGANVVLIPQDHYPQRRRLLRHAGKRAHRQRAIRPSPSSERSLDLQLVGSLCARWLRREALRLILGWRGPACDQSRRSSSRGEEGPPFRPVSTAATEGWRTRP